jgi:Uma2 family endonuclease
MSSEAVGRYMPTVVTLDNLTAMMTADEHHRYEVSPEGVLTVAPPPGSAHAVVASRLAAWLLTAGLPPERFAQGAGLRVPGCDGGVGGRIADLVVWSSAQTDGVWLPVADVLLVVEIIAPGSEGTDTLTKRGEYAAAGVPQYWVVDRDQARTVTVYRLDGAHYVVRAMMPLAWVLTMTPSDHGLD